MTERAIDLSPEAVAQRNDWRYKVLNATGPGKLRILALYVLNKHMGTSPRCAGPWIITSDGFVMGDWIDRDSTFHHGAMICDVEDLIRNFRGLAEHAKLTQAESDLFFAEIRKAIHTDYRSNPEVLGYDATK